jgi:hypothetical protein
LGESGHGLEKLGGRHTPPGDVTGNAKEGKLEKLKRMEQKEGKSLMYR